MNFQSKLKNIFEKNNMILSDFQIKQFETFFNLLVEWNKKMNLTSIIDLEEVITKHFLDSVLPKDFLREGSLVIDIGCGAGFPSIPLKIIRPDIKLTLVDSVRKKLNFVQEVVQQLELKEVSIIHSRAEELAFSKIHREKFDICVSRAVAELNVLSEYCLPFIKINGYFLAYKAQSAEEELFNAEKAIKILGGKVEKIQTFNFEKLSRKIIFIKKCFPTPLNFPRDKNMPRRNPL